MNRFAPHYQVTFATSIVPQALITLNGRTVHAVRGFTQAHAMARALRWMAANGDPRL